MADGVGLHHPIPLTGDSPTVVVVPAVTATTTQLLFGCGTPSDIQLSGNSMVCNIHVNRLMNAENKILYDWYRNAQGADIGTFATLSLGGAPTQQQSIPGTTTSPIQFSGTNNGTTVVLGGEPYANFYDFIFVNERHETNGVVSHTQVYDDVEFIFSTPVDRYLWELINNILIYKNDLTYDYASNSSYGTDYTNIIRTDAEQALEVILPQSRIRNDIAEINPTHLQISPLVTSFSSLDVNKLPTTATASPGTYSTTNLVGAGPGGLLVSAREYGYYAQWDSQGAEIMRGFLPTSLVENNYSNLFPNDNNQQNLFPTIRIKPDLNVNTTLRAGINNGYISSKPGATEFLFIYDAFSGYDVDPNYNPNTNTVKELYSKFYDGSGNRGGFAPNENLIYSMDKLKWDPFNPILQNPNGRRGFSNDIYSPSEYELSQMSAFDHIITQGRLLRLTCDPYTDMDAGWANNPIILGNSGFGLVGNGGLSPDNKFYGRTLNSNYTVGDCISTDGTVEYSKSFTFNTSNSAISYMKELTTSLSTYWQASYQKNGLFGYGLTLLNQERYMVDDFFNVIYRAFTNDGTMSDAPPNIANLFNSNIVMKGHTTEISINLEVKTKNMKNSNGTPYNGNLCLIFNNIPLPVDKDSGTLPVSSKGWGYVDNIAPIIERSATI